MLILFFLRAYLSFGGYITPEQLRLSWTENPNEMRVTWVTFLPIPNYIYYKEILCPSRSDNWKTISSDYNLFDEGQHFIRYQYIHTGVIPLINGCSYEYYVGSWLGWSGIYTFSSRTPGSNDLDSTSMVIVGDWGAVTQGLNTKNLMSKELKIQNADGIIHVGDFAYDLDDLEGMVGDAWLKMVQPLSANYAYMAVRGNHENYRNSSHFKTRFKMPYNEANQGTGQFYSFDFGRAHYVAINTESYIYDSMHDEELTQTNWLIKDLEIANKNRDKIPWIVLLAHRSLYCSPRIIDGNFFEDCGVFAFVLKSKLEEIVYEAGVDVFIQAHVHNYERTKPVYKNNTVESEIDEANLHYSPRATVYIVNGNAGNCEGLNDPIPKPLATWSAFGTNDIGYGRIVVYNSTHLYYEQYSAFSDSTIDYVWIVKNKPNF